jgi:hypothetical protein
VVVLPNAVTTTELYVTVVLGGSEVYTVGLPEMVRKADVDVTGRVCVAKNRGARSASLRPGSMRLLGLEGGADTISKLSLKAWHVIAPEMSDWLAQQKKKFSRLPVLTAPGRRISSMNTENGVFGARDAGMFKSRGWSVYHDRYTRSNLKQSQGMGEGWL